MCVSTPAMTVSPSIFAPLGLPPAPRPGLPDIALTGALQSNWLVRLSALMLLLGHGRLRDADAGARQVGFEDGRRGVSRSVGHRPGIQHQGSAATRKSRAVAAPRSARFPREQLSVQVDALHFLAKAGVVGISQFIVVNRHSFVFPAVPNSSIRRRLQKARPPYELRPKSWTP